MSNELFAGLEYVLDAIETYCDCIAYTENTLMESDEVISVMADTNASAWHVYQFEVRAVRPEFVNKERWWVVTVWFGAEGDQHPDKMHVGDKVEGTFELRIHAERDTEVTKITCEMDYPDDDRNDEPDDDPEPDDDAELF